MSPESQSPLTQTRIKRLSDHCKERVITELVHATHLCVMTSSTASVMTVEVTSGANVAQSVNPFIGVPLKQAALNVALEEACAEFFEQIVLLTQRHPEAVAVSVYGNQPHGLQDGELFDVYIDGFFTANKDFSGLGEDEFVGALICGARITNEGRWCAWDHTVPPRGEGQYVIADVLAFVDSL